MNPAENARVGNAIEEAAELLPEGWCIHINVWHHGGDVQLHDPEGNDHTFPTNHEFLSDEIRDAIEYAKNWREPQPDGSPCPEDCPRCSGEYCDLHGAGQCDCDVLERHGLLEE